MFGNGKLSYSGSESYRYLKHVLNGKGPLLVVSPYIDVYYASALKRISASRKVYVIASSIDDKARKYLIHRRISWNFLALALIFLVASIVLGLLSLLVSIAFFEVFLMRYKTPSNIFIKVPASFVHAKIYISDEAALYGSANLTYAGMHKNIEHIELTRNKDEIESLSRQFWKLWRSASKD
ncbi:MAG: phospholipase D-like domain-containing protein [Candidatus Micrarchaeaceae archaeon]